MRHSKPWFIIINPTSGKGSSKRLWPRFEKLLIKYGFQFDYAFTSYGKHSIFIVQEALYQGFRNIVCVGGDGTIHNIVNGIFSQKEVNSSEIKLGVIPIGTGNDWVKTYNISKDPELAIQTIKKGNVMCQDIGRIEFLSEKSPVVYFNNLAGVGFDGYVVSKIEAFKHLGALAYITGALVGILSTKSFSSRITHNSEVVSAKALMILVGICKFSGGGMQLTNDPKPNDGLLDLSIADNFSRLNVLTNIFKLFNGKITRSKKIVTAKASRIKIEIEDDSMPFIQADGELIGQGGFEVTILPKALSFFC